MPRCRIAVVGCGRWGQRIVHDLCALGCEVVAADPAPAARESARTEGVVRVVGGLAEVPSVDAIVVATPAGSHPAVVEEAVRRRVPVFCEKPLAVSAAAATRLVALGGDRLFVMDKWRYHPGVEALRDLAASGELGPVVGLRTTRTGWSPPQVDVDAIWTLAPHDLSIALEILGAIPEPRAAVAECLDGRPVSLAALLGTRPWFVLDVAGASPESRREIRLTCRHAVALLPDAYSDHLLVLRHPTAAGTSTPERRPISTEAPLLRELRTFIAYLAGGPAPKSRAADGAAVVSALVELRRLADIETPQPRADRGRLTASAGSGAARPCRR